MIRLGPITICKTRTFKSYQTLATATWELHRAVWYGDPSQPDNWKKVLAADAPVADALSRMPQEPSA